MNLHEDEIRSRARAAGDIAVAGDVEQALASVKGLLADCEHGDSSVDELLMLDLRLLEARILQRGRRWREAEEVLRDVLSRGLSSLEPEPSKRLARAWLGLVWQLMEEGRHGEAVGAGEAALEQLRPALVGEEKEFVADFLLRIGNTLADPPPTSFREFLSPQKRERFKRAIAILEALQQQAGRGGLGSSTLAAQVVVDQGIILGRLGATRGQARIHARMLEAYAMGAPAIAAFRAAAERAEARTGNVFRREAASARLGEAITTAGVAPDEAIRLLDKFLATFGSDSSKRIRAMVSLARLERKQAQKDARTPS